MSIDRPQLGASIKASLDSELENKWLIAVMGLNVHVRWTYLWGGEERCRTGVGD